MFSLWLHDFLTLSTLWKEMEIDEKEGGLPVFDTDSLFILFYLFFLLGGVGRLLKLLPNSWVKWAQI